MADLLAIDTVIVYGLPMDKILISACLMGDPVRYDGAAKPVANAHLARWHAAGALVVFCPEIAGGFSTPRLPAEIEPDADAAAVLAGAARILDSDGKDVTAGFVAGAKAALLAAQKAGCRHAILTDGSPSCGPEYVFSGRFDHHKISGTGVTTELLVQNGIQVWTDSRIDELASILSIK